MPAIRSRRDRVLRAGALCGFFLSLAVLYKLPVWLAPLSRYGGLSDQHDPLQTMWFLSWVPHAIGTGHNPLFSDYINYPTGINLLWNTSAPALGVLLWPVTAIWGAIASYNVITTLSVALASLFAFVAIRRWVRRDLAAAVGALVYGFSPFLVAQDLFHANIGASAITIPLGLLLVDELVVRQAMRPARLGALIAGLGVLQFFIFEELFVTEVIAALVLITVIAIGSASQVRARLGYVARSLSVATAIVVPVLGFPAIALQLGGRDAVHGAIHDPNTFVTDLINPVVPTAYQLVAPTWVTDLSTPQGWTSEWSAYIGLPLLVLMVFFVVRARRSPVVRSSGIFAAVMLVLSMGPHLHVAGVDTGVPLPWWPVSHVPLLQDIQPNRLIVFFFLAAALLVALAVERAHGVRWRRVPAMLVAAVALIPMLPLLPQPSQAYSVPAYFIGLSSSIPEGSVVLAVTCPCPYAMDALAWQTVSGMQFKTLGGYFFGPRSAGQDGLLALSNRLAGPSPPDPPTAAQRADTLAHLRVAGVTRVILGSVAHPAAAMRYLNAMLGPALVTGAGVTVWAVPDW